MREVRREVKEGVKKGNEIDLILAFSPSFPLILLSPPLLFFTIFLDPELTFTGSWLMS
jgi:hypothetical protein